MDTGVQLGYRCATRTCGHKGQHRQTHSTRINTDSASGLILYLLLVVQVEGWLVEKHANKTPNRKTPPPKKRMPPAAGLRYSQA